MIPNIFNGLTVVFALVIAWLALPVTTVRIMLFYALFSVSWFMAWYPMWPFVIAVLLPPDKLLATSLLFTFSVFTGHFLFNPMMTNSPHVTNFSLVELLRFSFLILPVWLYYGFQTTITTAPDVDAVVESD